MGPLASKAFLEFAAERSQQFLGFQRHTDMLAMSRTHGTCAARHEAVANRNQVQEKARGMFHFGRHPDSYSFRLQCLHLQTDNGAFVHRHRISAALDIGFQGDGGYRSLCRQLTKLAKQLTAGRRLSDPLHEPGDPLTMRQCTHGDERGQVALEIHHLRPRRDFRGRGRKRR
ncbi:hypothetical protein CAL14_15215 [Bordetella genomosp. 9]|nr:hypothetical protein CAL14_15215 [Bordetella genomosp. 9]